MDIASARRTRGSSSGGCAVLNARPATTAVGTVTNARPGLPRSTGSCAGATRFQSSCARFEQQQVRRRIGHDAGVERRPPAHLANRAGSARSAALRRDARTRSDRDRRRPAARCRRAPWPALPASAARARAVRTAARTRTRSTSSPPAPTHGGDGTRRSKGLARTRGRSRS